MLWKVKIEELFLDILKIKQCFKQKIDFCKFFEDFEKSKAAIKYVEMWNLFKNIAKVIFFNYRFQNNTEIVDPNQINEFLKQMNKKIVMFFLKLEKFASSRTKN